MRLVFEIGEQEVENAINSGDVRIQLNFDTLDPQAIGTPSTNNFQFTIDGSKIINQYVADGKTGGVGVFEGLPSSLKGEENGEILPIIDGYLDLSASNVEFECDLVSASMIQKGGNDWYERGKNSFTYAFLFSLEEGQAGKISTKDWVQMPYVVSSIPDNIEIAMISLMLFSVVTEVRSELSKLSEIAFDFTSVRGIISSILKLVVRIAYLIILLLAIINLIRDMVDTLIQPVKYHAGMRLVDLLNKGAEYMGLKVESTILDDPFWHDVVVIPPKYQSFNDQNRLGIRGFKRPKPEVQTGYYNGTFGDIVELCKRLWNAREIVGDGVLRLERIDKNVGSANYVVPDVEILKTAINADDLKSNTQIRFSTDITESNTIDEYKGTLTSIVVEPQAINNRDMVLMKGFEEIIIPFAQTKRKNKLGKVEEFFKDALKTIDRAINGLNKVVQSVSKKSLPKTNFAQIIEKRLGMAKLEKDYFQVPKVVALNINKTPSNTKIKDENSTRLTSIGLWNESYFVNSFVPSQQLPAPNQWEKYITPTPIKFCFEDYKKVINNNVIFDSLGREGKIISLEWTPEKQEATLEYWVKEIYTTNLKETIDTPDGF